MEALERLLPDGRKLPSNAISEMKIEKGNSPFKTVDERLARKGNRIYARVSVNGKLTWRSTKTNRPPQAKKWLENWDGKQWAAKNGLASPEPASKPKSDPADELTVNKVVDDYIAAGQPTVRKRSLKAKSQRSVQNEQNVFRPIRAFFGPKLAPKLTLNDVDEYYAWRRAGGYVARFKLRGNDVVRVTKGGDRGVDLELTALGNALSLAVRRSQLPANPLRDRGRFADKSSVRHCREVAPTPDGLIRIVAWMKENGFDQDANLARYLAYTGLRISEGLRSKWSDVQWKDELIDVRRSKKGVCPWALILPETAELLRAMRKSHEGNLLFPSPFNPAKARDDSSFRHRLAIAARKCGLPHVTPQGLRSYFVTQARLSGMTDAEIAYLIGDRTGPTLIAEVYGDVRPDHLFAVARKIQVTAKTRANPSTNGGAQT